MPFPSVSLLLSRALCRAEQLGGGRWTLTGVTTFRVEKQEASTRVARFGDSLEWAMVVRLGTLAPAASVSARIRPLSPWPQRARPPDRVSSASPQNKRETRAPCAWRPAAWRAAGSRG